MEATTVIAIRSKSKFLLGRIAITDGAMEIVSPSEVGLALARHCDGDWGSVNKDDWAANDSALDSGNRILSAYESDSEEVFWIITEWDRGMTTILLPSEY